jgi:hypothetical protein
MLPALSTPIPSGALISVAAPVIVRVGATLPVAPGAKTSTDEVLKSAT